MSVAHRLNNRVLLQRLVQGKDPSGAPTEVWENVVAVGDGKIWAGIRDLTGRQYVAAGGTQNAVQTEIETSLATAGAVAGGRQLRLSVINSHSRFYRNQDLIT